MSCYLLPILYVKASLLRRAKAFLRSNYSFSEETNAGKAENLGFYASIDDVKFTNRYLEEIDKVTKDDVVAAANKYLSGGYYCVKLVGQPPKKTNNINTASSEEMSSPGNYANKR